MSNEMPEHEGSIHNLVDALREKLYRPGKFITDIKRSRFSKIKETISANWQGSDKNNNMSLLQSSFLKKLFAFSLSFFVLALVAATYIVLSRSNIVSTDNLDLALKGPVSVRGGDEFNLQISLANNNSIALESVDMIVSFPEGTRQSDNPEKELLRYRKDLGTIESGQIINEQVKALLFGLEQSEQIVTVAIEYRTVGSNAIFQKEKSYKVPILSAPLNLVLSASDEVYSGDHTAILVDVGQGSSQLLRNILLVADYPSGFKFEGANPQPIFGNNVWMIGDVASGTVRQIKINGTLEGQEGEKKFFRITAGTKAKDKNNAIGVPFANSSATVQMRRSFIDLASTINGVGTSELTTNAGEILRGDITWTNNLPDRLVNGQIMVKFGGNALDQTSVSLSNGAYRSTDDTIIWSEQHKAELGIIESGTSNHVNVDFAPLSVEKLNTALVRNPFVELNISFDGSRIVEGRPGEQVHTAIKKLVRINSYLDLAARAVYSTGPFINSGPMPPRANTETTYTVILSLSNTSNDLEGTVVKAILPSHSRFVGTVSPAGADIKYDATRGELTWRIGRLTARASMSPVAEVSFQIALLPSVPQIGQTLPLMTTIVSSGEDLFTGAKLSDSVALVDMRTTTDPNFKEDYSKVVP